MVVQRLRRSEEFPLEELKSLAEAAGYTVVQSIKQVRRADPSYQLGKGKVSELAGLVQELNIEKIIFDNELKPIQAYNIAKVTGVEAISRFRLILEIFAKRASTREAQLQVQLATLRFQLPRIRESIRLARGGEQPGFMGLGRYEVDVHIEAVKRQISHIRKELKTARQKRTLQRTRRIDYGFPSISLAGYTYAGKTTLFNTLTAESKSVDQGLFTTLSTTTRVADFQNRKVLLTDTVGFIDRLPLVLVEAFHSTLEETVLSDAIILVVDFHESIKEIRKKLTCCIDTLNTIGAHGIPIVTAMNKADLLSSRKIHEKLTALEELAQNPVPISALKGTNLQDLKQMVIDCLAVEMQASFVMPLSEDAIVLISKIYNQVCVLHSHYEGKEINVTLQAVPWLLERIRGQIKKVGGHLLETNREVLKV